MAAKRKATLPVTVFARERPDGSYLLHYYPPGRVGQRVTADTLNQWVRGGQKVVIHLCWPDSGVCDVVPTKCGVRWVLRPGRRRD